ncbi:MAG: hypothetical protein K9K86_02125 [Pseudomonadales bacterium]|nr:hypothetical protein [Pseudomonadales bacterium]
MALNYKITAEDRSLLHRVYHGYYRNITSLPPDLEHLAMAGLIETEITTTLPILPIRYQVRLTDLGEWALKQSIPKT